MDKTWAIVELMGHSKIVGEISEEEIAGSKFLRVDVPQVGGISEFTKFYGASAIYAITPTDEATARRAMQSLEVRPVSLYMSQPALPDIFGDSVISGDDDDYDPDDDYEPYDPDDDYEPYDPDKDDGIPF